MAKSKLGQRAKVLESTCDCTLSIFKLIIVLKYPDCSDFFGANHCDPRSTEVSCKNLRNWNCLPCLSPLSVRTGQRLVTSIPSSQKLRCLRGFSYLPTANHDIFIRIPVARKFNPTIVSIWMYMGVSKHGGIHKIGGL